MTYAWSSCLIPSLKPAWRRKGSLGLWWKELRGIKCKCVCCWRKIVRRIPRGSFSCQTSAEDISCSLIVRLKRRHSNQYLLFGAKLERGSNANTFWKSLALTRLSTRNLTHSVISTLHYPDSKYSNLEFAMTSLWGVIDWSVCVVSCRIFIFLILSPIRSWMSIQICLFSFIFTKEGFTFCFPMRVTPFYFFTSNSDLDHLNFLIIKGKVVFTCFPTTVATFTTTTNWRRSDKAAILIWPFIWGHFSVYFTQKYFIKAFCVLLIPTPFTRPVAIPPFQPLLPS